MPPRMQVGSPGDWLAHAKGSLALAKARHAEGALLGDLCCAQAQPAAEKALCFGQGTAFPFVHNLALLLGGLEALGREIPRDVDRAIPLTRYAVETRYPGNYEPIGETGYAEAIRPAESVLHGVREHLDLQES